jgi:predicted MFS family arabinose efflux permease/quinol monooxygenase YgiN
MPLLPTKPLTGVLEPFNDRVFGMLWGAWFAANLTMWTNDVAAAWLMTQLTDQVVLVALVQSASTLPVFLLGLPSGALADIVDRRRYFASTQLWVGSVALILAALALTNSLTAHGLLMLTFANGIGMAMRWPVFAAIIPDLVPKERLSAALSLNAVAMNVSRIVGPALAGMLLASFGSGAVFVLNAALAMVSFTLIMQWKSAPRTSALPGERFVGAMRVGLQHVWQSPRMRGLLLKIFLMFFQAAPLTALMPYIAKRLGTDAGGFTLLLASMGVGAVIAALNVNRVRVAFSRDHIVRVGTAFQAAATVAMAFVPNLPLGCVVMFFTGAAWISTVNTLTMSAQMSLPNWVRARGMSTYQVALMGGSAAGAAVWGQLASWTSLTTSMLCAAAVGFIGLAWTWRLGLAAEHDEDLTPAKALSTPVSLIPVQPDAGPVMVTVEYQVDLARAAEFATLMQATRAARLRQGALSWGLFRDTEDPSRYIEYFVDESWVEHLRRHERFTAADVELREMRRAFHLGEEAPRVRRYVAEPLRKG